jgi:sulfite reductase (NADPH) hemoprotein beta-component
MAVVKPVKRPPLPVLLNANDVLDGDVVFHTGTEWSLRLADALIASDDETAARLESIRDAAEASGEVIEPYLVTVALSSDGRAMPIHYRERLRVLGPSVRLDLGKQAELAGSA